MGTTVVSISQGVPDGLYCTDSQAVTTGLLHAQHFPVVDSILTLQGNLEARVLRIRALHETVKWVLVAWRTVYSI